MTPDSSRPRINIRPSKRHTRVSPRRALDTPQISDRLSLRLPTMSAEAFGALSERFARFMGTPKFLVYMTVFVVVWLAWNTLMPAAAQFDPRGLNYTLLTLILSLQASYAAPLILLAQNRQDDRDRVALRQDRQRAERSLADTEYLAREVAALRIAMRDVSTRDYLRSELRSLVDELQELAESLPTTAADAADVSADSDAATTVARPSGAKERSPAPDR